MQYADMDPRHLNAGNTNKGQGRWENLWIPLGSAIILGCHFLFLGHNPADDSSWWQVVEGDEKNFFRELYNILYWQFSNTPAWSINNLLGNVPIVGKISLLTVLQAILHWRSMVVFAGLFPRFKPFVVLLFLNPLVFHYFNLESYEFISFFILILLMRAIVQKDHADILLLTAIFSVVNIKFHFILVAVLIIGLFILWKAKGNRLRWSILLWSMAIVFVLPLKNLALHGSFGHTFWLKFNVDHNYTTGFVTQETEKEYIQVHPIDTTVSPYISYERHPMNSYVQRDFLKQIQWSDMKDSVLALGPAKILKKWRRNTDIFFRSPIDYNFFFKDGYHDCLDLLRFSQKIDRFYWVNSDTGLELKGTGYLSLYHLLYPLLIAVSLFIIARRRRIDILSVLTFVFFFFFLTTILIDGKESNRMRFSIEPLFYFILFTVIDFLRPSKTAAESAT